MIERNLDAGVAAAWAAGDEVYGDNPHLHVALEQRQLGYVLAVSSTHRVPTPAGDQRANHLAKKIPKRAWQKLSAGRGAKGHRWYDWAQIAITAPGLQDLAAARGRLLLLVVAHASRDHGSPVDRHVRRRRSWVLPASV
ncbi:hypothetical protein ABZX74_44590 [Streptomyces olivaceoviridis]